MLAFIQRKYNFTDYQIAQLKYTFTILFSELSKLVLISFFFRNCFVLYLYAAILLGILRMSTGGLHAKTYWGCLFMSLSFFYICVYLLPQIRISKNVMIVLILGCLAAIRLIGPVPSVYRKPLTESTKKRLAAQSLIIIFIHLVLFRLYDNKMFTVGNWVIVLQTIQLIIARIYRNYQNLNEEVIS